MKNTLKGDFYKDFQIDSLNAFSDFEDPLVWSYGVYLLLEQVAKKLEGKKIVAQFHEWMAGFPILLIKKNSLPIATVFTTHATMLGRSLAGNGVDLYAKLSHLNPGEEAYRMHVEAKYLTERQCAQYADVFTTVSEITSIEAEKILGRKADILLLNGLDITKFPDFEEISIKHRASRKELRNFLSYYFFPYYPVELSHNLMFYIVGRYEYRNKGIDLFIRALGRLNEMMKKEPVHDRTITALFWIPAGTTSIRKDLMENKIRFRRVQDELQQRTDEFQSNIIEAIATEKDLKTLHLFKEDFLIEMKKIISAFRRHGTPPLCTHELEDEKNDPIMNGFRQYGLLNREEDLVKVIFYPTYLNAADGLANLDYYEAIAGCHLGAFPSYYEPYGYTPLESAANGVPAITTDLAGFGRFIQQKLNNRMEEGIFVLQRMNRNNDQIVEQFAKLLYDFSKRRSWQRVENKINAKRTSTEADWRILIKNYYDAHDMALEKLGKRQHHK